MSNDENLKERYGFCGVCQKEVIYRHWGTSIWQCTSCNAVLKHESELKINENGRSKEPLDFDHEYTREIVCPYCGYTHHDSWELQEDDGDMDCESCGETFEYFREVQVSYSTNKKE